MIQGIDYLDPVLNEMKLHWPKNRLVNIVCHGHSVPAGYFATPYVNSHISISFPMIYKHIYCLQQKIVLGLIL